MKSVFISRALKSTSAIRKVCKNKAALYSMSLLTFSPISLPRQLPECDWLFFYSQKGVQFFLDQIADLNILSQYKIGIIGRRSLEVLSKYGLKADFVGNGHPIETAYLFLNETKAHEKILFFRANQSRQSIQKMIQNQRDCLDIPVYQNTKKTGLAIPKTDISIFMSPLNVSCYIDHLKKIESPIIIAIGNTTADCLKEYGYTAIVPAMASEESIAEVLGEYLRS